MIVPGMEQNLFGAMSGTLLSLTYPSLRFYFWDEGEKRERTREKKKRKKRNKKKENDKFARFPS